ncbi:hypothetical protein ACWCPS_25630 [Streptomyces mauvecolor]
MLVLHLPNIDDLDAATNLGRALESVVMDVLVDRWRCHPHSVPELAQQALVRSRQPLDKLPHRPAKSRRVRPAHTVKVLDPEILTPS